MANINTNNIDIKVQKFFDSVILTLKESKLKVKNNDVSEIAKIDMNLMVIANMQANPLYFTTYTSTRYSSNSTLTSSGFRQFDPSFDSLFLAFNNVIYHVSKYYRGKSEKEATNLLNAIYVWYDLKPKKTLEGLMYIFKPQNLLLSKQRQMTY